MLTPADVFAVDVPCWTGAATADPAVNANALAAARNEAARWGQVLATDEARKGSGEGGRRKPTSSEEGALCTQFSAHDVRRRRD